MTPKTLMSVEEFMALPGDGMHHELNELGVGCHAAAEAHPFTVSNRTGQSAGQFRYGQ
jgi:hypothetical protein